MLRSIRRPIELPDNGPSAPSQGTVDALAAMLGCQIAVGRGCRLDGTWFVWVAKWWAPSPWISEGMGRGKWRAIAVAPDVPELIKAAVAYVERQRIVTERNERLRELWAA